MLKSTKIKEVSLKFLGLIGWSQTEKVKTFLNSNLEEKN